MEYSNYKTLDESELAGDTKLPYNVTFKYTPMSHT